MSILEDILYEAFNEGIRDEVLLEVSRLRKENAKKYYESRDVFELAIMNVRLKKEKEKDENI
jgi:prophage maintenance system killer protein|tara:strand:- start:667 stop:852 length:186 start_codon:yes stop_codon:yes gene_type:complete